MKNITNKNTKNEYHGYQEWYGKDIFSGNKRISYRANYKNGIVIGYEEFHGVKQTRYDII